MAIAVRCRLRKWGSMTRSLEKPGCENSGLGRVRIGRGKAGVARCRYREACCVQWVEAGATRLVLVECRGRTDKAVAADLDRATDSQWDWVAEQTRTYLTSGGAQGHESDGVRMLVLATTGRITGRPRRTCLIYGTSGDDFVLVASKGGADEDPDWFKNLRADPSVGVQAGARRFTCRARSASSIEREALWPQMVRNFPLYEEYAHQTDRQIPVVLLMPQV